MTGLARILIVALACLLAGQAAAESAPIPVRYGDHPGFGRIVFDLPAGIPAAQPPAMVQIGDTVIVSIPWDVSLPPGKALPHNVRGIDAASGKVSITLGRGATIRRTALDGRLVLDALDPAPDNAIEAVPSTPKPRMASAAPIPHPDSPAEGRSRAFRPVGADAAPAKPLPEPAAATLAAAPAEPPPKPASADPPAPADAARPPPPALGLAASAAPAQDGAPGHVLTLPFPPQTGAAAFRRGADAVVVFDARRPVDLQQLGADPVFGDARLQLLPGATVLRLRLPPRTELRLAHTPQSWQLTAIGGDATPPKLRPIEPRNGGDRVILPASQTGTVLSVPDPDTGGILLVGTQLQDGEAVATARMVPDFTLLPTWQGVAVEILSDAVTLRTVSAGFALAAGGQGRRLAAGIQDGAAAAAAASRVTRVFDLPDLREDALLRRLQAAEAAAGQTPIQSRSGPRRAVVEAMLALGLDAEAQSVAGLVGATDARTATDPQLAGLAAAGAVLAGRLDEADALDNPLLDGSDEISFWRALRSAMRSEGAPDAAAIFANTLPLLQSYPAPLRARLTPLVAETMARGGQLGPARNLLDHAREDATLDLARAFLADSEATAAPDVPARRQAQEDALALYDRLATSPDREVRFRAATRGAELRLASGRATAAQTAAALDKLLYAWRDGDREVALRRRLAELLLEAGQGRQALLLLRESEALWPDRRAALHAQLVGSLQRLLTPENEETLPALDLVALAEENADLLPDGEPGRVLAENVTKRLIELDLPDRAMPRLARLIETSPPGVAKSTFGARLAVLRLDQKDPSGAIAALQASAYDTIPAALLEDRTIVFAKAVAAQGDLDSARRALDDLDTALGDETEASIEEAARNWAASVTAWKRVAARRVPPQGKLGEGESGILVRLASAAAQAHDDATLADIREHDLPRMPQGKAADTIGILTAPPVQKIADLPGVARDIARLQSVAAATPAPRPPGAVATP